MRGLLALCLLALTAGSGCQESASGGSPDGAIDNGDVVAADGAGAPALLVPEGGCEVPEALPPDPLVLTSRSFYKKSHLQDVDYDPTRGLIYVSGLPGLLVYQDTGGEPELVARYPPEPPDGSKKGNRDYQHLELVSESLVATSNRGNKHAGQEGVHLIDTTDVGDLFNWPKVTIPSAAGMAAEGERLYVASHDGAVYVVDLSDLDRAHESPTLAVEGLGNPWELVLVGDRAYVADNSLGVVILDLGDPDAPAMVGVTGTAGGPQDIVASDGYLYVASGSTGVEIFDLSDPDAPQPVSVVDIGGPVISVSVQGGLLATADHAGIGLVDVADPVKPRALAFDATESWAMHVCVLGNRVLLADWNALSVFEHPVGAKAPEARLSRDVLYVSGAGDQATFEISNQGSEALVVSGLSSDDPRLEVGLDVLEIPPGDHATAVVTLLEAAPDLAATVCVATNDPDQPLTELTIAATSSASSVLVGDPAPDFTLADLDGTYHTLSQALGHPVVLCYFATW